MAVECIESQEWIEEEIEKPVTEWAAETDRVCRSWPWPLNWACKIVTTLVRVIIWVVEKIGRWVVRTICKLVTSVSGLVAAVAAGLWDVLAGVVTGDWRRILDGLIGIGLGIIDIVATTIRIATFGDTWDFLFNEYQRGRLKAHVRTLLNDKYSGKQLQDIKDALGLDHGAFGLRITMCSVRTFLDSETPSPDDPSVPNLVVLSKHPKIDLHELCGFKYTEGFWNRKRYKTIKKGAVVTGGGRGEVKNPIYEKELETYLSSKGAKGPKFLVLCMRDSVLRTKLRAAEIKARELGLMPRWIEESVEVTLPEHINHNGLDTTIASSSLVSFLVNANTIGRQSKVRDENTGDVDESAALDDLCTPVAVGVFRYTDSLRGLAACLQKSKCQRAHDASGVTYIDNKPDIIWKYVLIHELGHYFGLCHADGVDRVMFSARASGLGSLVRWWTVPKLIYTKGEPSFTFGEAKQTWNYIVEHFPPNCLAARG